jgi:hypothetical protein
MRTTSSAASPHDIGPSYEAAGEVEEALQEMRAELGSEAFDAARAAAHTDRGDYVLQEWASLARPAASEADVAGRSR